MKHLIGFLLALGVFVAAHFETAQAESTRPTYPTVIGLEALGRAGSASLYFDRMLEERFSAGFGFGGGSVSMLPVYANYYFANEQGSLFLTGGLTLVLNRDQRAGEKIPGSSWRVNEGVLPHAGLGYENRSDQGMLFRATGYVFYADGALRPWGGVSFGLAF
ncbi:MAG: hypothetical protein RJB38_1050 [Pseudomonadota bacterium]|jgi:hypothetical protein